MEPYQRLQDSMQSNLAIRAAPLTAELMKSRALANRVAGRVGELEGPVGHLSEDEEDGDALWASKDANAKLMEVLSSW